MKQCDCLKRIIDGIREELPRVAGGMYRMRFNGWDGRSRNETI